MPSDIKECSLYSFTLRGQKIKTTPKDITARAAAQAAQTAANGKQDALTAAQLAAVNSGVTAEKVAAWDGIEVPTKTSDLQNDSGFITAEKFGTVTPTIGAASGFGAYVDFPAGFTYTNSVVISMQVAEGTSAYRAGQGVYTTSNMRLFAELGPSGVRMFCNSSHYFGVDCIVALMRIDI